MLTQMSLLLLKDKSGSDFLHKEISMCISTPNRETAEQEQY